MPSVGDIIRYLLPSGSVPGGAAPSARAPSWSECPAWPPDAFAVAATLVEKSACYARDRYGGQPGGLFGAAYLGRVREAGRIWREDERVPRAAVDAWALLVENEASRVGEAMSDATCDAAMELLAIADEACVGMGFASERPSPIGAFVLEEHRRFASEAERSLPNVRASLGAAVPHDRACVQPKSRASAVGCTLRALTHHLALVPSVDEVETRWMVDADRSEGPFNLLCVPFPYVIRGDAIVAGEPLAGEGGAARFALSQKWLPASGAERVELVAAFVLELVREAEREVGAVHGIVLPELALDSPTCRGLVEKLSAITTLELFISGTSATHPRTRGHRNLVFASLFGKGKFKSRWWQSKHHRWRLEESQIRRYHLGHVLDPHRSWWEDIDVHGRELSFYVFRADASIAVLVCEDLARIDPVQPVLRAMGPTLVIALLMDGPQLDRRWPGRYAGALTDDPGSSVLTFTSFGMLERSVLPGEVAPRQVALFKDPTGTVREIALPPRDHALVLSLSLSRQECFALDGRSDGARTVTVTLGAVRSVAHPSPPAWLRG